MRKPTPTPSKALGATETKPNAAEHEPQFINLLDACHHLLAAFGAQRMAISAIMPDGHRVSVEAEIPIVARGDGLSDA